MVRMVRHGLGAIRQQILEMKALVDDGETADNGLDMAASIVDPRQLSTVSTELSTGSDGA